MPVTKATVTMKNNEISEKRNMGDESKNACDENNNDEESKDAYDENNSRHGSQNAYAYEKKSDEEATMLMTRATKHR